jgi:hypothetical protein
MSLFCQGGFSMIFEFRRLSLWPLILSGESNKHHVVCQPDEFAGMLNECARQPVICQILQHSQPIG